ncbi:hypothetical protein BT63DRAFT_210006 [Microthyrium microscopicum]|uniref:Uncharacterized protein n=1 Tax=Microthyrium microscopicum TaxID=703497 RepID=A0A6A6UI00_9PEZI|nr:hypothetical protein BT63DRAFT_210006 [Microthyrium microscopicum]
MDVVNEAHAAYLAAYSSYLDSVNADQQVPETIPPHDKHTGRSPANMTGATLERMIPAHSSQETDADNAIAYCRPSADVGMLMDTLSYLISHRPQTNDLLADETTVKHGIATRLPFRLEIANLSSITAYLIANIGESMLKESVRRSKADTIQRLILDPLKERRKANKLCARMNGVQHDYAQKWERLALEHGFDVQACYVLERYRAQGRPILYPGRSYECYLRSLHDYFLLQGLGHCPVREDVFWSQSRKHAYDAAKKECASFGGLPALHIGYDTIETVRYMSSSTRSSLPNHQPQNGYYAIEFEPDFFEDHDLDANKVQDESNTTAGRASIDQVCYDLESQSLLSENEPNTTSARSSIEQVCYDLESQSLMLARECGKQPSAPGFAAAAIAGLIVAIIAAAFVFLITMAIRSG